MTFNLPHRANVGDIILAEGYDGCLLLVTEMLEEISYSIEGYAEEMVTYTCVNIDNRYDVLIIFDEDVISIEVTADESDEFIARRQKSVKPPAVQKPYKIGQHIIDFALNFEEERKRNETVAKKQDGTKTQRKKEQEATEYIDYLLDRYAELVSLEELLGADKERQSEIAEVKKEFMDKTGGDADV